MASVNLTLYDILIRKIIKPQSFNNYYRNKACRSLFDKKFSK